MRLSLLIWPSTCPLEETKGNAASTSSRVSLQPLNKTLHVTESARLYLLHPVAESMPFTLAYHLSK
jgi:hypothetical protein